MISLPSSWQATRLTPSTKTGRDFSKDHIGLHQGTVGAKLLLVHGRRMVLVQASQKSHCLWKKHYLAPLKSCTMEQKGKWRSLGMLQSQMGMLYFFPHVPIISWSWILFLNVVLFSFFLHKSLDQCANTFAKLGYLNLHRHDFSSIVERCS